MTLSGTVGQTHVALLRGINLGRAKRVAMADLRAVFVNLGYHDVRTVLQSGNVVFRAAGGLAAEAAAQIETALVQHTGVQAAVVLLTAEELLVVAESNPLLDVATDPSRLLVTFLAEPPDPVRLHMPDPVTLAPEVVRVGTRAVYQWCPEGVLASKLPASFWRQFGPSATARNWRTVTRLVDLVR
ncbi:MAG: DUF1697 domain-containing protein [Pseudonocardiaceae bacterium]